MRLGSLPVIRQVPPLLRGVDGQTVLFESWHGEYSDNPRAISEALRERDGSIRQIWANEGSKYRPNSRAYLEALGQAAKVITNLHMPGYYRKKEETQYVQTWHGTPLKLIGFDIERFHFEGKERYVRNLTDDVSKWDTLIAQNRFSAEIFRRAFRFEGEILETGYPRNDVLSSPDRNEIRQKVRNQLGIPRDCRAILYAPTWREKGGFSLELDLARLTKELGDDWRLMFRAHRIDAEAAEALAHQGVIDVTGYPEVAELYLAADLLVTDYSSVMFDFAVTGKPMAFYTYDLEEYRDEVRGFYFDFESEAPGPLASTFSDLYEQLRDPEALAREHAGAYRRFAQRFCYLDDGRASERVLDAIFSPAPTSSSS